MDRESNPYAAPEAPLLVAERPPTSPAEWTVYWVARAVVAFFGLGFLSLPVVASRPERLLALAIGLPMGALMLIPNRLTVAGWPFVGRLVLSILVGLLFIAGGFNAISDTVAVNDRSAIFLLVGGFFLPFCLWWRSLIDARERARGHR